MAGYQCDSPDCPQPVTVLITSLNTGQTQTSCDEHIPVALIGNLAGYLEVNPQTLYDSIKRFSDREAARQAKAAAEHKAAVARVEVRGSELEAIEDAEGDFGPGGIMQRFPDPLETGEEQ